MSRACRSKAAAVAKTIPKSRQEAAWAVLGLKTLSPALRFLQSLAIRGSLSAAVLSSAGSRGPGPQARPGKDPPTIPQLF